MVGTFYIICIKNQIFTNFISFYIIYTYFFIKKKGFDFLTTVDILAPAFILGQSIGRWGNFINQEAYGGIVSENFINKFPDFIKNQMYIAGNYHHPAFLYESLGNIIIFLLLIYLRRKKFIENGDIFAVYLIGYSTARFFIEKIRIDSLMFGGFMVARILSIILIGTGFVLILLRHRKNVR